MRPPVFNYREKQAIENADRLVFRLFYQGVWRETFKHIPHDMTLEDFIIQVRKEMADSVLVDPNLARVGLYVGGIVNGELSLAVLEKKPTDAIPEEVKLFDYRKRNNVSV